MSRRIPRWLCTAGAGFAIWATTACKTVPPSYGIDSPAGCYQIDMGEWAPPFDAAVADKYFRLPTRIVLELVASDNPLAPKSFMGNAILPDTLEPYQWIFWRQVAADTIEVWQTNGFSSTSATLVRADSVATGVAHAVSDVTDVPVRSSEVVARRIQCPADS